MFRLVTYLSFIVVSVIFAIQNADHVPVFLIYGKPVQIRMVFVMAICGTAGYLIATFSFLRREENMKRQLKFFRTQLKREPNNELVPPERMQNAS